MQRLDRGELDTPGALSSAAKAAPASGRRSALGASRLSHAGDASSARGRWCCILGLHHAGTDVERGLPDLLAAAGLPGASLVVCRPDDGSVFVRFDRPSDARRAADCGTVSLGPRAAASVLGAAVSLTPVSGPQWDWLLRTSHERDGGRQGRGLGLPAGTPGRSALGASSFRPSATGTTFSPALVRSRGGRRHGATRHADTHR